MMALGARRDSGGDVLVYMQLHHFSLEVAEVEDAHWRLYGLPVVSGGAEPLECIVIVRALIEDRMVYPGIPMPQ